jgi:hypothetical protein
MIVDSPYSSSNEFCNGVAVSSIFLRSSSAQRMRCVPKFMSFVDHHQVPLDGSDVFLLRTREVDRRNHDSIAHERFWIAVALCLPVPGRIEDHCREIEFLLQLHAPLLTQRCRADDKKPPPPFRPVLAEDKPRLDGLAEAHLVRENNALAQRRLQSKHRRVDLVWIQVHDRVEQGHRQPVAAGRRPSPRQLVGDVSRVIGRGHWTDSTQNSTVPSRPTTTNPPTHLDIRGARGYDQSQEAPAFWLLTRNDLAEDPRR